MPPLANAHAETGSLASAIGSTVWVACLSGHVNARLILDGTSHGSTLATVSGDGGAVNKLLLREADQLGRCKELAKTNVDVRTSFMMSNWCVQNKKV